MQKPEKVENPLLDMLRKAHENVPFNRFLGLKVEYLRTNEAGVYFTLKDEFIGNPVQGILHGGVISAVLDAVGGMTVTASALEKIQDLSFDEINARLAKMGTIDLRVDFLRPGKGKEFRAAGIIMRTGSKVAVTRMELRNQDDVSIAVGTGAYIVG